MLEDLDRMIRQITRTSQHLAELYNQFRGQGPLVSVQETEKSVRLIVENPPEGKPRKWAVRVAEETLHLRGTYSLQASVRSETGAVHHEERSEDFVRTVPLPCPVESRPTSMKREGPFLILTFPKRKRDARNGWVELDM